MTFQEDHLTSLFLIIGIYVVTYDSLLRTDFSWGSYDTSSVCLYT